MSVTSVPTLADLSFLPYLTEDGQLSDQFNGSVGVYAIFDADRTLQFIGYSRDVALSLRQHLVRCPQQCHWLKVKTIDRPNRAVLEEIRAAWTAENGSVPLGNSTDEALWTQPIDAKQQMTAEEQAAFAAQDDAGKIKLLKQVARRVEETVLAQLSDRGVTMPIRFDPKLKESGLLGLK